ncbi:MAG: MBL fold metallo-hydrolase [Alphaproteobacteria bacterium]|nr:MBL fold metallo-hydrolase [Alphaproteobacteria bacterium]
MKITILGCGGAGGVPMLSVGWKDCDPNNPKNNRLRPSILVEENDTKILIDTSPDLRMQLLNSDTQSLDAILYTHQHADHIHGIDDIREINRAMNAPLPIYTDKVTMDALQTRFSYVFKGIRNAEEKTYFRPCLTPNIITPLESFNINGTNILPIKQDHGYMDSLGFKFNGKFAYSTDVLDIDQESLDMLHGLDLWVVGCYSFNPHPTHAHLDKILEWADYIKPKKFIITHMSPIIDYEALKKMLPSNAEPAYDGMTLEC